MGRVAVGADATQMNPLSKPWGRAMPGDLTARFRTWSVIRSDWINLIGELPSQYKTEHHAVLGPDPVLIQSISLDP